MFRKLIDGRGKIGIILHILSATMVIGGFYQLTGYGGAEENLLLSPLQVLGIFAAAPIIAIIGSTVLLSGKLDRMTVREASEPVINELAGSVSEESKESSEAEKPEEPAKEEPEKPSEPENKEEKPGLASRIKNMPLWLMVLISTIVAAAITFLVMYVIFRILV